MRPTGSLHLGHYHGVLKNWITLQHEYECFFFVADWHALTTHYDTPEIIEQNVWEMVIDWLAAGVDPGQATLFIQSRVPEHAELHLLLSMVTPLGWLERIPSYKDQQEKLTNKDLSTYGFLGYPLLQSADILIYRANRVPVGEDQVPHIEFTREIARRFNHIFGREAGFEQKAEAAIKKLGAKRARLYRQLRTRYMEKGDAEALDAARTKNLIVKESGIPIDSQISTTQRVNVVSPMDGTVIKKNVEVGQTVTSGVSSFNEGTALYTVADVGSMLIKAAINEVDIGRVRLQMPVVISIDAFPYRRFDGIVTGAAEKGTWVRIFRPPIEGKLVRGRKGLDIGDRVRVKLIDVDPERGFIDFARS